MKILLCSPIHEKKEVFELYLKHIRNLEIPKNVQLDKFFILHNAENLKDCLEQDEKFTVYNNTTDYHKDDSTHYWKAQNFTDVVMMKNLLIEKAIKEKYDYIFYVDSDLMLHKKTLKSLFSANKDMVAEIFWTKWNDKEKGLQNLPNCWDLDHYQIFQKNLAIYKTKGCFRTGMTGACTLIKRKVFENPIVNWNMIYNLSHSVWEDRAFCTRVAVAGYDIWIDTHYPAKHLYTDRIYNEFVEAGGINE
jgi:GT2 family glycosyltransferase